MAQTGARRAPAREQAQAQARVWSQEQEQTQARAQVADMGTRAKRAAVLLGAALAVFLAAIVFSQGGEGVGAAGELRAVAAPFSQAAPSTVAAQILAGNAQEALGALRGGDALPAGFADEVLAAGARGSVSVSADAEARVVGFAAEGAAADVFECIAAELCEKGWARVESGLRTGGSFCKEEGVYRWVLVMCYQVGERTSVVVQYH